MQIKSKNRVQSHGEVYTNQREVNAMLDLVKSETERIDSRFLEPACGNGNFLAEILNRKLKTILANYQSQQDFEHQSLIAISTIYGVDILQDNVSETTDRLCKIIYNLYCNLFKEINLNFCQNILEIISKNIIWGNTLEDNICFYEWVIDGKNISYSKNNLKNMLKNESGVLF